MGANLVPVFSPDLPDAMPEGDIRLALTELEGLDELARRRGLRPLSAFLNDLDAYDDVAETDIDWHPVHEALATVRGLRAALDEVMGLDDEDREILAEELTDLEQCLTVGEERKARFCLIAE